MMLPTATATNGWKPSGMSIAGSNTLEADYEKLTNEALQQRERIVQLEQLCRDLFLAYMDAYVDYAGFTVRMRELGLLEGE